MRRNIYSMGRTAAIIYGIIMILLLSLAGCSSSQNQNMTTKQEVAIEQESPTAEPVAKVEQSPVENSDKPFEIIPRMELLPLDLNPHEPISKLQAQVKGLYGTTIGPLYEENWRMQLQSYKRDKNGITAKFKFGNTGSTPITLNNNSMYFRMASEGGEDIAYSKLLNGPITVDSQQIVDLAVYSPNPESVMFIVDIEDSQTSYRYFFGREFRKDNFEPSTVGMYADPVNAPMVSNLYSMAGNGSFKFIPVELKLINNNIVGSIEKKEGELIGLLKIKIINTSEKDMFIDKFEIVDANINTKDSVVSIDIDEKILKTLGENAIPMVIKSKTIEEGYVPVVFTNSSNILCINGFSNLGNFAIKNIETFPFSNQLK